MSVAGSRRTVAHIEQPPQRKSAEALPNRVRPPTPDPVVAVKVAARPSAASEREGLDSSVQHGGCQEGVQVAGR